MNSKQFELHLQDVRVTLASNEVIHDPTHFEERANVWHAVLKLIAEGNLSAKQAAQLAVAATEEVV